MRKRTVRKRRPSKNEREPLTSLLGDSLDDDPLCDITDWISTGSCYLDWAISGRLRNGGIPIGRLTECYGGTSTGKTLLAMQLAISAQEMGYDVVYYDTEAAFSTGLFAKIGGDPSTIVYRNPDTVEELFVDIQEVIRKREAAKRSIPMLIIWDSIAASSAKEEMDKNMDEAMSPAIHARKISMAMRKLSKLFPRHNIAFFATNQHRKTISSYGSGYTTFGGLAVGFYSSVRVELRIIKKIAVTKQKKKKVTGIEVNANVVKNKTFIPYLEARIAIMFNQGIDDAFSALKMAQDLGIVSKSGSWNTIKLGGQSIRFQQKTWTSKVWRPHKAAVMKMLEQQATEYLEE